MASMSTLAACTTLSPNTELTPVSVPNSVQIDMLDQYRSDQSPTDAGRRLLVYVPSTPAPEAGFPVIFLLDGNAYFRSAVDEIRLMSAHPVKGVEPAIIVGVGYPIDTPHDIPRRWFDLTPPTNAPVKAPLSHMAQETPIQYGGAQALGDFIEQQAKPWLAAHYPVDKQRYMLMGHSLGGLFTLNTLLSEPERFQKYVAISPSLWWNDHYLPSHYAKEMTKPTLLQAEQWPSKQVLIVVGGNEKPFMKPDAESFATQMSPWLEEISVKEISHMNHGMVVQPGIALGLEAVLGRKGAE
jgi:predicted alpha/beta superfamily hydrolase